MFHDRYGMPLSTNSAQAARCYDAALDRHLAMQAGVVELAREALDHDDAFALAWHLLAMHQMISGDVAGAQAGMARAQALISGASERERSALQTLASVTAPVAEAEAAFVAHLARWPRDGLVLSQVALLFGMLDHRPDRDQRHLRLYRDLAEHYGEDWYFQGQLAFALEECRDFAGGLAQAEASLAGNGQGGSAAHTYAHVLLETGRIAECAQWLARWRTGWQHPGDEIGGHLLWHQALCELACGDVAAATAKLEALIAGPSAFSALTDGASLAWRMHLDGLPLPGIAERLSALPDLGPMRFIVAHKLLVLALAGDAAGLERLGDELAARDPASADLAAMAAAFAAFAREDWATAVDRFAALVPSFHDFGGSHAQAQMFDDTLIAALVRAGRRDEALDRLQPRIAHNRAPRDVRWADALARSPTSTATAGN